MHTRNEAWCLILLLRAVYSIAQIVHFIASDLFSIVLHTTIKDDETHLNDGTCRTVMTVYDGCLVFGAADSAATA
jgi:hypothetical protein